MNRVQPFSRATNQSLDENGATAVAHRPQQLESFTSPPALVGGTGETVSSPSSRNSFFFEESDQHEQNYDTVMMIQLFTSKISNKHFQLT